MTVNDPRHPALHSFKLDVLNLSNRFAVAPMTRVSAEPDGTPTPEMADYYREFAIGGFGLIITEGIYPDTTHSQGYFNQPGLASDQHVAGWHVVVDAVHAAEAPIIAQLMHAGALSQGNGYGYGTIAASAVQPRGKMMPEYGGSGAWPVPRAMNHADIDAVVEGFVAAAGRARDAGFDGVEIHAANGYLLDQFLTDYSNKRDDEYGGAIANRIRLTARILGAIRSVLGGFPVGVRLSQTKVNDFGYRWPGGEDDARTIFGALADATYLHIASEGRDFIETARLASGTTVTALAGAVSGRPVIANGGMHDLDQAARVIEQGHADILSLGHGALANPDLPQRVEANVGLRRFDQEMLQPTVTLGNARAWHARRNRSAND